MSYDSFTFYCHRINTSEELKNIEPHFGIELDLRDNSTITKTIITSNVEKGSDDEENGNNEIEPHTKASEQQTNNIVLAHDPFEQGENFDTFLSNYNQKSIILNVKSERIEPKVLELLRKHNVRNYFFLDCSFPMIVHLNKMGERNIAIRLSEFEPVESILKVAHMVKWVWVDCFSHFPLVPEVYRQIKQAGLKICLVSPELQGHDTSQIRTIKDIVMKNGYLIDAVCTKHHNIQSWCH
jgi:hypothetical protein